MPKPPEELKCPHCGNDDNSLIEITKHRKNIIYRCEICTKVWSPDKNA